jgi:hypothetical protein
MHRRPATDRGAECGQFIVGEPPSALGRLVDEETCAYSAKLPPSEAQPQDAARPEDDGESPSVGQGIATNQDDSVVLHDRA